MSDYTTQLRFICESYANRTDKPQPQEDVDEIIRLARPKLFSFDYPIFDENYREHLETKIMSHFYTREIGLETVGLFKHHLKNKMREIMPYYNQMYLSEKLKFDPFMNTEMSDSHNISREDERDADHNKVGVEQSASERDASGHTDEEQGKQYEQNRSSALKSDTEKKGTEKDKLAGSDVLVKHSDTPLGAINAVTAVGNTSNYLSDVTQTLTSPTSDAEHSFANRHDITDEDVTIDDHGGENSRGTSDNKFNETSINETSQSENLSERSLEKGTLDYFGKLFGKTGTETYSEMLMKFRQTFMNIDLDIIHELDNLFMLVW